MILKSCLKILDLQKNKFFGKITFLDEKFHQKAQFLKKRFFWKTLKSSFAMTNMFQKARNSAFESPVCIFSENKKIFILPQFNLMSATIEEVPKSMEIQIFSLKNFHPSSMVAEIKGDWERIKKFFYFSKVYIKGIQTH